MSVDTWEEFCQYTWTSRDGGTTLYTELEGTYLYYFLVGEDEPTRRYWLDTDRHPTTLLTYSWNISGDSPLATNPMTQQEKVCKKIALMEKRWKNFQERKQHA